MSVLEHRLQATTKKLRQRHHKRYNQESEGEEDDGVRHAVRLVEMVGEASDVRLQHTNGSGAATGRTEARAKKPKTMMTTQQELFAKQKKRIRLLQSTIE